LIDLDEEVVDLSSELRSKFVNEDLVEEARQRVNDLLDNVNRALNKFHEGLDDFDAGEREDSHSEDQDASFVSISQFYDENKPLKERQIVTSIKKECDFLKNEV